MLKRIILSVFLITMTVTAVATATYAYFTDGKVLGNNTFASGNVYLGDFNVTSLTVTGLVPGVPKVVENFGVNYVGNIDADLYAGARGTLGPGQPGYIADKLYLRIYDHNTSALIWQGYTSALSSAWRKVATNISAGWQAYDLQFTLDASAGNTYQNVTNTDTEILIYSVQTGGPVPTTVPYMTSGYTNWFDLP